MKLASNSIFSRQFASLWQKMTRYRYRRGSSEIPQTLIRHTRMSSVTQQVSLRRWLMFQNRTYSSFFQLLPAYSPFSRCRQSPCYLTTLSFLRNYLYSLIVCKLSSISRGLIILSIRLRLLRQASLASMVFLMTVYESFSLPIFSISPRKSSCMREYELAYANLRKQQQQKSGIFFRSHSFYTRQRSPSRVSCFLNSPKDTCSARRGFSLRSN